MRRFQFRWFSLLATLCLAGLFLRLGWWQWQKAVALETQVQVSVSDAAQGPLLLGEHLLSSREVHGQEAIAKGYFEPEAQFFLDNQQHEGRPGVHVITPLRLQGSQVRVWVNRGWVAWPAGRDVLPKVTTPEAMVEIRGRLSLPSEKPPAFVTEPLRDSGNLRMRIRLDELRSAAQYPVQPLVMIAMTSSVPDGLVRDASYVPPTDKVPMHKGYAIQWGLMTLLLVGFFLRSSYTKS